MSDFLDAVRLAARVEGSVWGPLRVVPETASTNADVAALGRAGAGHGLVVATPYQRAGRGRFDRVWSTPPDTCVAMSVLVRPRVPLAEWGWLSLLVGLAVVDGLAAASGVRAGLKWPNDVLVGERKICGILCEAVETPTGRAAVLGMGINIALAEGDIAAPNVTSLLLEGSDAPADAVSGAVLVELTGKASPLVCFVPTASGDDPQYINKFLVAYGTLGVRVMVLTLWQDAARSVERLAEADLVLVGNGLTVNTVSYTHLTLPTNREV